MQIKKYIICAILIATTILIDQWSKGFLIAYLKIQPGYYIEITNFFDLVYAWNYGASFGFFKNYFQYSNYFFMTLNSIITIILIWLLSKHNHIIDKIAFSLIIGGALGNIIDRITRGAVFDFIYLHYNEWNLHFPVFNLADSFITIGAIIFFTNQYYLKKTNNT